jgi:hypothetical protein
VYTLGEPAKATGLTKSALSKAIKKGRISAVKDDSGRYRIDPAELHRVFPPVSVNSQPSVDGIHQETGGELPILRAKLEAANEVRARLENECNDLRRRLDEEASERRKAADEIRRLTLLLTYQREVPTPRPEPAAKDGSGKGALWEKLFGRK